MSDKTKTGRTARPKRKPTKRFKLAVWAVVQDNYPDQTLFCLSRLDAVRMARYWRGYPKHSRIVEGWFTER